MTTIDSITNAPRASVNGVCLGTEGEHLSIEELRQRACTELLRQAAQRAGLLAADDAVSAGGIPSQVAADAIEALLDAAVQVPEPSDEACRRYHLAHPAACQTDERVQVRHILFAVTPGVDVSALRKRAEACLLDVRCHSGDEPGEATGDPMRAHGPIDSFSRSARELSNCPSGAEGGALGWLTRTECAPEFARELFGRAEVGVLPGLVHSRFGLHVVEVLAREAGTTLPFDAVRGAVAAALRQQSHLTALRQYLRVLAGQADVVGVDLDASDTPLVQ